MKSPIPLLCMLFLLANANISWAQDASRPVSRKLADYAVVRLEADISALSDVERKMLSLFIDAAKQMDDVFWLQSYGDKQALLSGLQDESERRFCEINYGPWDRLDDNKPFLEGVGDKPLGARYYPEDMTKEEFEKHLADYPEEAESFKSLYTIIGRDGEGRLKSAPYHVAFAPFHEAVHDHLHHAAAMAPQESLRKYLALRADALLDDNYQKSDLAWLDMKDNRIDIVIGPIENYEDKLFSYKAAHEAYVLIKDMQWSERLSKYAAFLPELQTGLPVDDKYKQEKPGSDADLNAYDVVYYAGDCNAGSKTIAINLPNDEEVQLQKGTRRLQLKNAMRAKFDKIMLPIAKELIVDDQRQHVTFNAFFSNTMFHEVAHGLGIKYTIGENKQRVRDVLRDLGSAIEEGKADILGLYMFNQLWDKGEITEGELEDYYVTFMAGIFRSVRFGASSAHGRANMIRFNFFEEQRAFTREANGKYRIDMDAMKTAIAALSRKLLTLQGDGDYEATSKFVDKMANIPDTLAADLERLNQKGIPVDVVFEQGADVLGL